MPPILTKQNKTQQDHQVSIEPWRTSHLMCSRLVQQQPCLGYRQASFVGFWILCEQKFVKTGLGGACKTGFSKGMNIYQGLMLRH